MLSNITLSAEKDLIARARARAQAHNTTLNAEFRAWLQTYADEEAAERVRVFREIMSRMNYASSGGHKITRDEMNERR